jgi:sulfite exporter TauE/SafE
MNTFELYLVFLAGFLGSAHCIGMCGGLVMTLVGKGKLPSISQQITYFGGKTFTYTILGGLIGWLGYSLAKSMTLFQNGLSIVAGIVMVFTGLGLLNVLSKIENRIKITQFKSYQQAFRSVLSQKGWKASLSLGLLNGLLPCGLVYSMLAKAATYDAGMAMLTMFVFGLSTIPALLMVGILSKWATNTWRTRLNYISGVIIIILGCMTILRGTPYHAQAMSLFMSNDAHKAAACCTRP